MAKKTPRCETCKHWRHHVFTWGWCSRIAPNREKPAWIITDDMGTALATDKDFGCVLHEKEDN